jgi:hypothetical protein
MMPIPPAPPGQPQLLDPGRFVAEMEQQRIMQRDAMEAALMCLGVSAIAAREFTNNGILSLEHLRMLSKEGLERLIKQIHRDNQGAGLFIAFFAQESVHAMYFWCNRMHILGIPYELDQITEDLALNWNEARKAELEAAKAPQDIIKQPEAFKKETKWKQWKESMLTYLHSNTGQASLPLAYIVREFDQPNHAKVYNTVHDQLVECAILHGPEYNVNNGLVYDLLQYTTYCSH